MFVHWGAYSVHGWEPSWPLVGGIRCFPCCQDFPSRRTTAALAAFDPPVGAAREWMRLARRCGMRYAVLTTKHHDGFALFPSAHCVVRRGVGSGPRRRVRGGGACRRAPRRALLLAARLAPRGLPAWRDDMRPYAFVANPRSEPARWQRFLADLRGQLTDLLGRYGPIDVLWFDGGWERTPEEWGAAELESLVRRLQPDLLINDRLPGVPGDYETPEQSVPAEPPARRWETCLTLGRSWGNPPGDVERKSAREVVTAARRGGGEGRQPARQRLTRRGGRIPAWQRERLETIGGWVERHAEALFGTTIGLAPWQVLRPEHAAG